MVSSFVLDDKCLSLEGLLGDELDESFDEKRDFSESDNCPLKFKKRETRGFSKKFYMSIIVIIFISISSAILFQRTKLEYMNSEYLI